MAKAPAKRKEAAVKPTAKKTAKPPLRKAAKAAAKPARTNKRK